MTAKRKTSSAPEPTTIDALRQGWLAYIGAYGLAAERAKPAFKKVSKRYSELFGDLVAKGEEMEADAIEQFGDVRAKAKEFYGARLDDIRSFMPTSANDRVKELEAKVESLTKKLAAQSRKTTRRVKAAAA